MKIKFESRIKISLSLPALTININSSIQMLGYCLVVHSASFQTSQSVYFTGSAAISHCGLRTSRLKFKSSKTLVDNRYKGTKLNPCNIRQVHVVFNPFTPKI